MKNFTALPWAMKLWNGLIWASFDTGLILTGGHYHWRFDQLNRSMISRRLVQDVIIAGSVLCILLPPMVQAQRGSNWRVFKTADGLSESGCAAVSVSPRGHVYVKHLQADTLSWLDGYEIYHLPAFGEANCRIYEVRTNHLWSLYKDGIQQFKDGLWTQYPIAPIQSEYETNLNRHIWPLSILPAKREQVLFLLPYQLMEYSSLSNQAYVIRRVQDTRLEKFYDMAETRDGGIWITGAKGVARLPALVRNDAAAATWREFLAPESLLIQNLQRPHVDDDGGITMVAESLARNEKVLVYFDGQNWSTRSALGSKTRQAWRGLDGSFWAQSIDTLVHLHADNRVIPEKESPLAGQIFDVAVEPKGVFWLATSEGLLRYAPLSWRSLEALAINPIIHAMVEDRANNLWFAGPTSLVRLGNDRWENYNYPDTMDLQFKSTDMLVCLSDGRLVLNATDHLVVFDPETHQFKLIQHPLSHRLKLVGQRRDGTLCVQVVTAPGTQAECQLEIFDGRTFQPWWKSPPNWTLGPELSFCYAAANGEDYWLGGSGGIGLLRNQKLQIFSRADGEPPDAALSILELGDGGVWCGGLDKIFEFDGKKWSVVRYGFDRVNSMIRAKDGSIWVASGDGIGRYFEGSWLFNGVDEGLPSTSVYEVYQDHRGVLWAGTALGLSMHHASADIEPPRTSITIANNQREFTLDSTITLVFHGQDKWKCTLPQRLLFSYRRDNLKWTSFNPENTVSFKEATPGKHRFEVRSMDRNGNYDHQGAVYDFSVFVPWYLEKRLITIFFGGLVVSLFFAALAVNRHWRLKRSYAEVGRMVAQRTHELEMANQALLHSQKMQALGTLAAGIAHDFNNILSIIKGSAQIIESNLWDKEKIQTRVNRIKTVVEQGAGIVKAMLGYSRDTGKSRTLTEINSVIDETVKMLGDRFLHEIELHGELAPNLPGLLLAKELLQQILLNLILNAADALSGHGRVTVRTGQLIQLPAPIVLPPAQAHQYVFVTVEDAGTGIAPEVLTRIFEPFFTTKSFSSRRGTGLGLSMVYEIAKDQGYGLQVESSLGKGSIFTVFIPVLNVPPQPAG